MSRWLTAQCLNDTSNEPIEDPSKQVEEQPTPMKYDPENTYEGNEQNNMQKAKGQE